MFNKQLIVAATVCATVALAQLNQPVFVDTDWVDHMIQVRQQVDFKIVDCSVRGDDNIINFHQGHLPNAIFIDLNYFRNMTNKYPYMLPGQTQFIDAMKLNGIKKSTRVIFYDTQDGYWATRCYWQLRTYGHENASVLNGGYRKWVAEGRRVEQTLGFENGASSDDFNYQFKPELYRTFEQIV
jgi:thiosulfate/3-mercaptopyruvate sulfurtransferase